MLTDTFSALGNPVRLQIVEQVLADGETAAGDFKLRNELSAPALSRHLKVLREAGILNQRIDAQRRIYSVRPETVKAIADWSLTYKQFWSGSFDRLSNALDMEAAKQ